MAKIRALKPEFFTDDRVVELSPLARLLFQGMWIHACDNGHIEDRPRQLKLRILPADDCDTSALLEEIIEQGMAKRTKGWLTIPTLGVHQKPDKRYFLRCDFPGCRDERKPLSTRREAPPEPEECPPDPQRDHHESPARPPRAPHVATRSPSTDGDGDGDGDGDTRTRPTADASDPRVGELVLLEPETAVAEVVDEDFEAWWDAYDKKTGKRKAHQKWRLALKKPGVTVEVLMAATRTYVEHQRRSGSHPQFTKNPETWLNGEHWNDQTHATGYRRTGGNRAADMSNDEWAELFTKAEAQDRAEGLLP